jgi:hypothetical protein
LSRGSDINCTQINPAKSRPKPIPVGKTKLDPEAADFWIVNAAAEVLMVAPDVVSTTDVLLGAPRAMCRPETLLIPAEATGVTEDAKKLVGYIRVMAPPERMAEVTGSNIIGRVALAFPATPSESEIAKIKFVAEAIMQNPDGPIQK